ncbi:MAG TPA: C4-type zinc ribbon domain-containing protein [Thermodesulfobacteriota bacterium]|nr:C4-type zinc ribbon domain-containing protein [Thermodesulfobacteriota bacterium]
MRAQLELLWELQKIDLGLKSIQEEKDRYPTEMKKLDEKQKVETERIEKEKEKIESLEKTRRQKEGQLNLEQEKIKRAEAKMFEVKTNKEYQALLGEIDAIKGANSRMEEEILRVMDEIDELKKDLSKREKDVGATLEKIEAERKKLQQQMGHDDKVWEKQMERREALSKQIETKLVKLYNTLKEKRQGVGVVGVKRETCQGCFVNVPPQLFIEVQKNNALVRCPHCNRILYWEGDRNAK